MSDTIPEVSRLEALEIRVEYLEGVVADLRAQLHARTLDRKVDALFAQYGVDREKYRFNIDRMAFTPTNGK